MINLLLCGTEEWRGFQIWHAPLFGILQNSLVKPIILGLGYKLFLLFYGRR